MYELEELIGKINSPEKVQALLNKLEYDYEKEERNKKDPYSAVWNSPKIALEQGRAICVEGALIAAALLGGSTTLVMHGAGRKHAVFSFCRNNLFGAVGKHKSRDFEWREPVYNSIDRLVLSYGFLICSEFYWGDRSRWAFSSENLFNYIDPPPPTRFVKPGINFYRWIKILLRHLSVIKNDSR